MHIQNKKKNKNLASYKIETSNGLILFPMLTTYRL